MSGRRFSEEQWRAWISEQKSSGLSVSAFCRRIGVSQNSFYRRRRLLGAEETVPSPFVAVSLAAQPSVIIELPCGAVMRVPTDESSLHQVLSILWEFAPLPADEVATIAASVARYDPAPEDIVLHHSAPPDDQAQPSAVM